MVYVASPALLLGTDACHTHFKHNSNNCVEHHFPELSLLNMVQIIGYVNNAQCLLEAFTVYPNPTSCNTQCHTSSENVILVKDAWTLFSGSILPLF